MRLLNLTLFVLTMAVLLSSCTTQKRCLSKFSPEVKTEYIETIKEVEKTVYRDTVIQVEVPGKVVEREVIVEVPTTVKSDTVWAKGDFSTAYAYIDKGKLKIKLEEGGQLSLKLENAVRETRFWRDKATSKQEVKVVNVKYIPQFWLVFGWIGIGTTLIGVAVLLRQLNIFKINR